MGFMTMNSLKFGHFYSSRVDHPDYTHPGCILICPAKPMLAVLESRKNPKPESHMTL